MYERAYIFIITFPFLFFGVRCMKKGIAYIGWKNMYMMSICSPLNIGALYMDKYISEDCHKQFSWRFVVDVIKHSF